MVERSLRVREAPGSNPGSPTKLPFKMKKERQTDQASTWYDNLREISRLPAPERYRALVELHKETIEFYLLALERLDGETARQKSKTKGDTRTIAQVVVHIMAWEEWQLQVFTDPQPSLMLPLQMQLKGYWDGEKGTRVNFANVDDFNKYQAEKYKNRSWEEVKTKAIATARRLQSLFPENPSVEWVKFLESSPAFTWKVTPNLVLTLPAAYYLWMVSLEHAAIEHRRDLEFK